jgi:hypothetical protein
MSDCQAGRVVCWQGCARTKAVSCLKLFAALASPEPNTPLSYTMHSMDNMLQHSRLRVVEAMAQAQHSTAAAQTQQTCRAQVHSVQPAAKSCLGQRHKARRQEPYKPPHVPCTTQQRRSITLLKYVGRNTISHSASSVCAKGMLMLCCQAGACIILQADEQADEQVCVLRYTSSHPPTKRTAPRHESSSTPRWFAPTTHRS